MEWPCIQSMPVGCGLDEGIKDSSLDIVVTFLLIDGKIPMSLGQNKHGALCPQNGGPLRRRNWDLDALRDSRLFGCK